MLNLSLAFQMVNCVRNIVFKMSENLAKRTLKTKIQLSQSEHKEKRAENIRSPTSPGNTHHIS
jgi:hypothetical protein